MYKNELAKLAGVSNRTFQRYLATRRPILTAMGVSPFARKLPPPAVRFISEDYCIDLPPPNVMSSVVETSPCHLDQRGEISRLSALDLWSLATEGTQETHGEISPLRSR